MADDAQFNVNISTVADTSGAEAQVDALKAVEAEAAKANEALASSGGDGPGDAHAGQDSGSRNADMQAQLDREATLRAAMAGSAQQEADADTQSLSAEETKASLMAQRQVIVDEELEALRAEAAGENEAAAALRQDIELRTQALALQQRAAIAEEEAFTIVRQRMAAEAQIAAEEEAQVSLNNELIAQEEAKLAAAEAQGKVYGRGGQTGNALKNLGVDPALATTIGIAVLAAAELNRQINEMAKAYDEASRTAEKQSEELSKQVEEWKEMASTAKDMNDVVKVTESVNKGLESLTEKLRNVKGEGSGGFFQNMTDGLKGWSNMLGDAYRQMSADNGIISQSTANLLSQQGHLKTSTEEAQDAIADQIGAIQKAGQVYEDYAQRQAAWFESLKAQPIADQIAALIEKEGELITQQQGVQEGTTRWAAYQKQIDEVVKAEDKAIAAQGKDAESIGKLDDQINKLTADRKKQSDEMPKAGSQNDFVKVDNESIGGVKTSGYYHPSDTTTNAAGNVISKGGAIPVDPSDPALKAFLDGNQKLDAIDKKLGELTAKRDATKEEMTGKTAPSGDTEDTMDGRATPDADEADFQETLNERAGAPTPPASAPPQPVGTAGAAPGTADTASAAQGVSTAATADAATTKTALDAASQAFAAIPDHFSAFQLAITTGTDTLTAQATSTNDGLLDYFAGVSEGFQTLGDNTSTALQNLQQQLTTLNQQLNSFIDSQNT